VGHRTPRALLLGRNGHTRLDCDSFAVGYNGGRVATCDTRDGLKQRLQRVEQSFDKFHAWTNRPNARAGTVVGNQVTAAVVARFVPYIQDDLNHGVWGNVLERPDAVEAVGLTNIDLNRAAPELRLLQDAPADVAILNSVCANRYFSAEYNVARLT